MARITKRLLLSQTAIEPFLAYFRYKGAVPTGFSGWTFLVVVRDSADTAIGISGAISDADTGEVTFTPALADLATLTAGELTGEILYKSGGTDVYSAGRLTGSLRSGESWT